MTREIWSPKAIAVHKRNQPYLDKNIHKIVTPQNFKRNSNEISTLFARLQHFGV